MNLGLTCSTPRPPGSPTQPSAENPWDRRKVGHLYRRAGFGATAAELDAGVKDGHEKTLDRILNGGAGVRGLHAHQRLHGERAEHARRRAAGAARRRGGSTGCSRRAHPLREKLTLFWHNHFATSNAKVQNARYMLGQYRLMQPHALGSFRELLLEMSTDPAMMVWLDTDRQHEGQAERELRPRADGAVLPRHRQLHREGHPRGGPGLHRLRDQGRQGRPQPRASTTPARRPSSAQTGKFKGEDIAKLCLEQDACPRFIVRKLYRFLVSESDDAPAGAARPARRAVPQVRLRHRQARRDDAAVEPVLLAGTRTARRSSRRSSSPSGIVRGLEGRVGTLPLAEALEGLGQVLFAPPSVKGWDGGPAWLNGQTLLFRQNLALALTSTEDAPLRPPLRPGRVLAQHGVRDDDGGGRLLPRPVPAGRRAGRGPRRSCSTTCSTAKDAKYPVVLDRRRRRRTTASGPSPPGADAAGVSAELERYAAST